MFAAPLALTGLSLVPLAPSVAQDGELKVEAELVEKRMKSDEMPPISPPGAGLSFSTERPEGAPELAEELHGAHWARGEIAGKPVHVAIGRKAAEGKAPEVAWLDLNANLKFEEGERHALNPQAQEDSEGAKSWSGDVENLTAEVGGAKIPLVFSFFQHPEQGLFGRLLFVSWREGRAKLGDAEVVIVLVDGDQDGNCDGERDRWLVYSAVAPPQEPASPFGLSAFSEGRFFSGQRVTVHPQGCTRVSISATPAAGPDPRDLASQRRRVEQRWFEHFDKERDDFVKKTELDTSRPRAEAPIQWRYVSFDEAVALAAKEDKPLFVDVMAFWCVWCYRMDYYTYVDAEVAKLLSEDFIPVKIIEEQDPAGDYERVKQMLEARGIPAMGIFDTEGEVLHKISGWEKPSEFVESLRKGLAIFRGEKG